MIILTCSWLKTSISLYFLQFFFLWLVPHPHPSPATPLLQALLLCIISSYQYPQWSFCSEYYSKTSTSCYWHQLLLWASPSVLTHNNWMGIFKQHYQLVLEHHVPLLDLKHKTLILFLFIACRREMWSWIHLVNVCICFLLRKRKVSVTLQVFRNTE